MLAYIKDTIIGLVEIIVMTGLILHMLPGEQYQKYVKLLLGIIMIAFILDAGGQFGNAFDSVEDRLTELYSKKLNFENSVSEKVEESQYSRALSTYKNKIKTILNKSKIKDNYFVDAVNISVCEDVDSVDYGEIESIRVKVSKNVDKSVNIPVESIIIGKMSEKSDDLEYRQLQTDIARKLELEEEVIQIVIIEAGRRTEREDTQNEEGSVSDHTFDRSLAFGYHHTDRTEGIGTTG